jgi:hypothetical protein
MNKVINGFEELTAVKMSVLYLWAVIPRELVDR